MSWNVYEVVFRLRTPLHSGWRKVGNLQMTRSYVTGRMLWGAFTMRLMRDQAQGRPATDSREYRDMGKKVHENLAFTYFYPAIESNDTGGYETRLPWKDEAGFRRCFLGSYASTALDYPQRAASEGSLHEVEFISPRTVDEGRQVYLRGYIFEKDGCELKWQEALHRLQLGGERGYGWGRVELVEPFPRKIESSEKLFGDGVEYDVSSGSRPSLLLKRGSFLLAHMKADGLSEVVEGEIEPLVGREWKESPGDEVQYCGICFVPGSRITGDSLRIDITRFGIWQKSG